MDQDQDTLSHFLASSPVGSDPVMPPCCPLLHMRQLEVVEVEHHLEEEEVGNLTTSGSVEEVEVEEEAGEALLHLHHPLLC